MLSLEQTSKPHYAVTLGVYVILLLQQTPLPGDTRGLRHAVARANPHYMVTSGVYVMLLLEQTPLHGDTRGLRYAVDKANPIIR
jgi:hypothetical protein